MEELTTQLRQIGLGAHEASVYSVLTLSSPASATFIAKKCRLSRSSVYTTLSALIAKGLVGTTYKNNIKQFIANDHSAIEQLLANEKKQLDEKFKTFETLRASIELFSKVSLNIPQIIFFEGYEGLKKIYLSMMRQAPEGSILYLMRDEFVWQPEWKFIFEKEWHERVKKIKIEKNIQTKLLVNRSKIEKNNTKFYTSKNALTYRFLPSAHTITQFALYIIGDTLSILSMEKNNLVGIQVINKHLVNNFQSIFVSLWAQSKN